ncbi:hypothetical protein [Sphingomonas sp. RIT328]|uniref:hypothetical protein n=1 Tax=Sphingomonas sp. RIT328 TaxID=1470591 RepID=UPI000447734F|nr:hypothetical protein [Sphingomonas sp. RIT328]EZP56482.1 hypothetical protein BW41_00628 [Sphingomonas sp. RIT328]
MIPVVFIFTWFITGVVVIPITAIFFSFRRACLYALIWALPFSLQPMVHEMGQVETPWHHHKANSEKLGG